MWSSLGTRSELCDILTEASGIEAEFLKGETKLQVASIAKRMSWVSQRITTRREDIAYCLLGIFDVNMPLLYGEGEEKAFIRLQEEIMKNSDDQTIFAWGHDRIELKPKLRSILARSPAEYAGSGNFVPARVWGVKGQGTTQQSMGSFSMTNLGLHITLPIVRVNDYRRAVAALNCYQAGHILESVVIPISPLSESGLHFARVGSRKPQTFHGILNEFSQQSLYFRKDILVQGSQDYNRHLGFLITELPGERYGYDIGAVEPSDYWQKEDNIIRKPDQPNQLVLMSDRDIDDYSRSWHATIQLQAPGAKDIIVVLGLHIIAIA